MKKPKTERVARTRAGGTKTEAEFWSFLRSGLRRMSQRWPPRNRAFDRVKVKHKWKDHPKRRFAWVCEICGGKFSRTEVQAHHPEECGALNSWQTFMEFAEKEFVEEDGFQILCKECHKALHKKKRKVK